MENCGWNFVSMSLAYWRLNLIGLQCQEVPRRNRAAQSHWRVRPFLDQAGRDRVVMEQKKILALGFLIKSHVPAFLGSLVRVEVN